MEPTLNSTLAIDTLIQANGDAALAAERLHVPKQQLIAAITADPLSVDTLQRQLRTLTLLGAYELFDQTKLVYLAQLADIDPKTLAKTMTTLLVMLTQLTQPTTQNISANVNITEVVLRMLPPDARAALQSLVAPINVIENNG